MFNEIPGGGKGNGMALGNGMGGPGVNGMPGSNGMPVATKSRATSGATASSK